MSGLVQGIFTDGSGKNFLKPIAVDIRSAATSITQTVNASGSTTAATYTFADGSTITDTFTYGSNSSTNPTGINKGNLTLLTTGITTGATTALSNFSISTDGTKLNYSTTTPTTAITGVIVISGSNRTLTHISSGLASISGSPVTSSATGITTTISTSSPDLSTPVANVSVTNASTASQQLSQIALTPLTFNTSNGASQSGYTLTFSTVGGAIASQTIDTTLPFELITYISSAANSQALVIYLDDDNTANYNYDPSNAYLLGSFTSGGSLYFTEVGGTGTALSGLSFPLYVKQAKSGNDLIMSTSADGLTYTLIHTRINALVNVPTAYIKAVCLQPYVSIDIKLYR